MVEVQKIDTIEVGNTLTNVESSEITKLTVDSFDKDTKKDNTEEMKDALKTTQINVITSSPGVIPETKTSLSLWDIATQFDQYVERGEGWKLKIKEWKTDTPEWIKYIVENPKNNDLAYVVQKLAGLIEYQTARFYTDVDIKIDTVKEDKTFGNQTRRALAGLKNWIEDTATTEVANSKTYEWKYIAKMFLEGLISDAKNDKEKNTALKKYNLQYKWKTIMPLDTYEFIDPNSNNYAVVKSNTKSEVTSDETQTKENSKGEKVEKPINQDVFSTYIEQLQANIDKTDYFKTITDTKLIQTLWIINGQKKKVRKLTLVENNYLYSNPYIGVKITEAGKEYDQTFPVFKINLAEFTEKNPWWLWRKVDTLSFYRNIDKYMLEDINKKEKDKVQTDITSNYYKTVEQIKWKKYALNDLFPNIGEYEKAQYESFFKTFGEDKKLEIHNDGYVYLSTDKKKLYLDLNQNGSDKTYAEKIEFTISEITDSQWKFEEDAFKKKLASYVTSMVNEHFSV